MNYFFANDSDENKKTGDCARFGSTYNKKTGKIFAKHLSDEGLVSRTYRELLKLNNKKITN